MNDGELAFWHIRRLLGFRDTDDAPEVDAIIRQELKLNSIAGGAREYSFDKTTGGLASKRPKYLNRMDTMNPVERLFQRCEAGAAEIERLTRRAELAEGALDAVERSHADLGKRLADQGEEIAALRAERDRLRERERRIIDATWGEAMEDGSVPSTKLQDKIIAAVDVDEQSTGSGSTHYQSTNRCPICDGHHDIGNPCK